MAIRNDYILDMIAKFIEAIADALDKAESGRAGDSAVAYERVVGDVLDMSPSAALALSPESLVTMMRLSAVDESLSAYAAYALLQAAGMYEALDDPTGQLRLMQANAIASSYGIELGTVPPELQDFLDNRDE